MGLRLLLGLAGPLIRLLGVSALQDAMDALRRQFDAIEARQADFEQRLARIESSNSAVVHGWELMKKAREQLPHAAAAEPRLPGETTPQYARRVARHVTPDPDPTPDENEVANVEGEGDEPPDDHV